MFLPRCCQTSLAAAFQAAQKKKLWATSKKLMSHSWESSMPSKSKTLWSSQLLPSLIASGTSWNQSNTGSMWWETQSWSRSSNSAVLLSEFFLAHPPLQVSEMKITECLQFQWHNFVHQGIILPLCSNRSRTHILILRACPHQAPKSFGKRACHEAGKNLLSFAWSKQGRFWQLRCCGNPPWNWRIERWDPLSWLCMIHMKQYYTYICLPITLFRYPHYIITLLNMIIFQLIIFSM